MTFHIRILFYAFVTFIFSPLYSRISRYSSTLYQLLCSYFSDMTQWVTSYFSTLGEVLHLAFIDHSHIFSYVPFFVSTIFLICMRRYVVQIISALPNDSPFNLVRYGVYMWISFYLFLLVMIIYNSLDFFVAVINLWHEPTSPSSVPPHPWVSRLGARQQVISSVNPVEPSYRLSILRFFLASLLFSFIFGGVLFRIGSFSPEPPLPPF